MHSNSWIVVVFLPILLLQIPPTTTLHCYDDLQNRTAQLIDNCRACVIYIDSKTNISAVAPKKGLNGRDVLIEDFVHSDEANRRQRRWSPDIIIHQKCARELEGPIYGFDQTHCYCNSNLCNTNIQRCIYEIASKRYFPCYHGTNSTGSTALEISKQCRSCRIKKQANASFHYECLTFGEQEQQSETHCTCQHPMCNQDLGVCQRFHQISSQARANSFINSTESPPPPSANMNSTKSLNSTILIVKQAVIENSTSLNDTSFLSNETRLLEAKNHANPPLTESFFLFYVMLLFLSIYKSI